MNCLSFQSPCFSSPFILFLQPLPWLQESVFVGNCSHLISLLIKSAASEMMYSSHKPGVVHLIIGAGAGRKIYIAAKLLPFAYLQTLSLERMLEEGTRTSPLQAVRTVSPWLGNEKSQNQSTQKDTTPFLLAAESPVPRPQGPQPLFINAAHGLREKSVVLMGRRSRFQCSGGDNCLYSQGMLGKEVK